MRQAFNDWVRRNIIADDPNPQSSTLDMYDRNHTEGV